MRERLDSLPAISAGLVLFVAIPAAHALDATSSATNQEHDALGQVGRFVDRGGPGVADDVIAEVRLTPNLRAGGGRPIEYDYDFGHLVGIDYPSDDTGDVTYTWGAAALRGAGGFQVGRITEVRDGSGREQRAYDPLGQLVHEVRTLESPRGGEGSASDPQVFETRFTYDTWGRLQQMVYPDTEVVTYEYDSGGQVRAVTGVKLGERFPYVARLEYDELGQRRFLQTGNGVRTHYTYDPLTRRLDLLEAGDFQHLDYEFDPVGNITALSNQVTPERSDRFGGRVEQRFGYDALDRLVHAEGTWTDPRGRREAYTYDLGFDAIHNLTSKSQEHTARSRGEGPAVVQRQTSYAQSYAYGGPRPHAATQVGERELGYDPSGNLVSMVQPRSSLRRTLVWDDEDRVHSISDNGRSTRFVYDDAGERTFKIGAQGETAYVNAYWTVRNSRIATKHVYVGPTRIASRLSPGDAHVNPDPGDHVSLMLGRWFEHRSDSGHEHARNVEMNPHYRVPSDMPEMGSPETNFLYFYHPDHLSSTQYVTDADGELYEHVQYFPSGEPWVQQASNTERLPYLFTGQELDQETGLYYIGARYYDPRVGTWISTEPALARYMSGAPNGPFYLPNNLSLYAFSANNPVRYADPDGEVWVIVAAVVGT